jgi:hypothetical protein
MLDGLVAQAQGFAVDAAITRSTGSNWLAWTIYPVALVWGGAGVWMFALAGLDARAWLFLVPPFAMAAGGIAFLCGVSTQVDGGMSGFARWAPLALVGASILACCYSLLIHTAYPENFFSMKPMALLLGPLPGLLAPVAMIQAALLRSRSGA